MTANPSSENPIAAASTQDVRGSGLSVASGSPARPQTMDEWFLSLPPGRQAVLREDKWMLAQAAFIAGAQAGMREANLQ